jgi:hypothetical protein
LHPCNKNINENNMDIREINLRMSGRKGMAFFM